VTTEQFTVLFVVDDLDESIGVAERGGLSGGFERKFADLDVVSRLFGLALRVSDGSDLRLAVRAAGDVFLVHRADVLARDLLDAENALVTSLVREPGGAGDVSDRVHAVDVRSIEFVDQDVATVRLNADLLEADVFNISDHADSR